MYAPDTFLDERKLSCVFVPQGWELGSGGTIAASSIKALHPLGFKKAVKERVKYKGAEKDHDQVIAITNRLKAKYKNHRGVRGGPQGGWAVSRLATMWLAMEMHAVPAQSRRRGVLLWQLLQKQP